MDFHAKSSEKNLLFLQITQEITKSALNWLCYLDTSRYFLQYTLDISTIDKDSIVRTPRMEVVWEPRFIINKRGLFSLLLLSDVDLADGIGRLTVICRRQHKFIYRQGLYVEVFIIT